MICRIRISSLSPSSFLPPSVPPSLPSSHPSILSSFFPFSLNVYLFYTHMVISMYYSTWYGSNKVDPGFLVSVHLPMPHANPVENRCSHRCSDDSLLAVTILPEAFSHQVCSSAVTIWHLRPGPELALKLKCLNLTHSFSCCCQNIHPYCGC